MKTFYVTTPIYYPSHPEGKFHIGTAYTTVSCDVMKRYKNLRGYDTYYLTGTDEHGAKVETVAASVNKTPQEHVDFVADNLKKLWKLFDVEYDDFIRTTEARHEDIVQIIFEKLLENDDIYLGEYEGAYCKVCESFYTETQLNEDKTCPECGAPTEVLKEESYFLRLSKYADKLLKHIDENPDFIFPESRRNEVVAFVKGGLEDLCVSRTKLKWGVKVKSNPKHVVYVWIDALSNYLTALGLYSKDDSLYQKFWVNGDEIIHVVGKDILRFHAIYWPIMLFALDIPVKYKLFVHGWILMKDGKMSKSKGNVIYPEPLIERYGVDAVRYALIRELSYGNDGVFAPDSFIQRVNSDIANDYGNLVNRTVAMINKYFNGSIKKNKATTKFDKTIEELIETTKADFEENIEKFALQKALASVWTLISRTNKYIDETTPWLLAKDESKKDELENVLYHLVESIRCATILLIPTFVETTKTVFDQLGIKDKYQTWEQIKYGVLTKVDVKEAKVIFPRLDLDEEVEYILSLMNGKKKEEVPEITFEEFMKVDMRVGEVIESKLHPKADRLLVSKIDIDGETRQIVSGIAEHVKPEDFVGEKVVVVTNLKPIKLRGELSEGMILAAEDDEKLEVIKTNVKKGTKVK